MRRMLKGYSNYWEIEEHEDVLTGFENKMKGPWSRSEETSEKITVLNWLISGDSSRSPAGGTARVARKSNLTSRYPRDETFLTEGEKAQ